MNNLLTADANNLDLNERQSAELVRRWLDAVGLPPDCWPVDTDDAATILRDGGEYAIDADELRDLGRRGQVPQIESWDARDVLTAACALEARRQWRPSPTVHDQKKTDTRLAIESCIAAGRAGLADLREQLARYDLRLALVLMAEADNRQLRERLLSTIEALLVLKDAADE